jgi:hypothetical protein
MNATLFELGAGLLGVMMCLYMYVVCQIIDMGDVFYRKQRQITDDRIARLEYEIKRLADDNRISGLERKLTNFDLESKRIVALTETHDKLIMCLCSKGFRKSLTEFPVFNELFASGQVYNTHATNNNDVQYHTANSIWASSPNI